MRPDEDEKPFTVDDLVASEKRQMRWLAGLLLLVVLFFTVRNMLGLGPPPDPSAATQGE